MSSSLDPVGITVNALEEYVKNPHVPGSKRTLLLKLDEQDGQKILRAVPETQFTGFERIKAFFGCSAFNLSPIVTFLQTDFCAQLDRSPLEKGKLGQIQKAAEFLDVSIGKHNSRFWLTRIPIYTRDRDLTSTIQPHLHEKVSQVARGLEKGELQVAKELTTSFENKMILALKEGKITINERGEFDHSKVDPHFDQSWQQFTRALPSKAVTDAQAIMHKMINRAMVQQELQRLESRIASSPNFVERQLLEKFCAWKKKDYPSRESISQAQAEALREYLATEDTPLGAILPTAMKEQIEVLKQQELLLLCGIPKEDHHRWHEMIEALDVGWKGILRYRDEKCSQLISEIRSQGLPPIATDYFINLIKEWSQGTSKIIITDFIVKNIKLLNQPQTTPQELREFLQQTGHEFYKKFDEKMVPLYERMKPLKDFYQKWQPYLKAEMMQGFYDPGEALEDGVCHALALRWVATELKKSELNDADDLIRALKIGSISAKDRMVQASKGIGRKDIALIQERLGMDQSAYFPVGTDLEGREQIANALQELCGNNEFRMVNKGVGLLGLGWKEGAHAIAICFQRDAANPENSVYRLSDPNFGTFNFTPKPPDFNDRLAEKNFLACLTDLLLFYSDKMTLMCQCFKLKA